MAGRCNRCVRHCLRLCTQFWATWPSIGGARSVYHVDGVFYSRIDLLKYNFYIRGIRDGNFIGDVRPIWSFVAKVAPAIDIESRTPATYTLSLKLIMSICFSHLQGVIFFASLAECFNKWFSCTPQGQRIQKRYHLLLSDVLEINNK